MPNEPIIKPILASFPPKSLIYIGRRKNEETRLWETNLGFYTGFMMPTPPTRPLYDPTCGSGSLLLKVSDEAEAQVTLYGQEKDAATS